MNWLKEIQWRGGPVGTYMPWDKYEWLTERQCMGDPTSIHVPGDKYEYQVYKEDD